MADPQKAASVQAMLFDQKSTFLNLGDNHVNFTVLDDKKGPPVIKRMEQSIERVVPTSKLCQNISTLQNVCIIPTVLSHCLSFSSRTFADIF